MVCGHLVIGLGFNISWLRAGHPLLDVGDLAMEASQSLGLLLEQLRSPQVKSLSNSMIIVLINRFAFANHISLPFGSLYYYSFPSFNLRKTILFFNHLHICITRMSNLFYNMHMRLHSPPHSFFFFL